MSDLPQGAPRHSPWGEVQHAKRIADGIWSVSTAGHGGYIISPERAIQLYGLFPGFTTYSGARYGFEEDQDWCIVALAFPEHFSEESLRAAVSTVRHSVKPFHGETYPKWEAVLAKLQSLSTWPAIMDRVRLFEESVADLWEVGSMGTTDRKVYLPKSWWVILTRNRDQERRQFVFAAYPEKRRYSDEELIGLEATPKALELATA